MIVESYEDVIVLSGGLRSNHWETIHTAVSLTLQRYPTGVIIDCSGLTECNLQGAETFRSAMEFITNADARVIVAAVSAPVLEVLKGVPDVKSQLPIAKSVDEARASLNILNDHFDNEDHVVLSQKKKEHVEISERMIVVMRGIPEDAAVVDLAISLCGRGDGLLLLFPIMVPRELPLQSPMPEEECAAAAALNQGAEACHAEDIPVVREIIRARDLGTAVQESLDENPAERVLVGVSKNNDDAQSELKLIHSLLGKVNVPVTITRP
jgi:anti-anti-sigma regulatory factor